MIAHAHVAPQPSPDDQPLRLNVAREGNGLPYRPGLYVVVTLGSGRVLLRVGVVR